MKTSLLTILILLGSLFTYSQDWVWGLKASGNIQRYHDLDIAVDRQGDVVMAGYYQLKLKLGNDSLYSEDDYYSDIFLCRMDSAHHIQWLKHIEALDNYDYGLAVTLDDDKNIYLTGGIDYYVFISKYDSLGNLLWTCDFDHQIYGTGYDIATDQFDNVYITGQIYGSAFVAKVDYNGKVVWTKIFETFVSDGSSGNDIAVDEFGSAYVAGSFEVYDFKIDSIPLHYQYPNRRQTFVIKLSADGKVIWAIDPQGATSSHPLLALTSNGFYLTSIVTSQVIDLGGIILHKIAGNDNFSPFIARYDSNGQVMEAKINNVLYDGKGSPTDLVTDLEDNIYLTRTGGEKFHIEKYNSSLELQWEKYDKTYGEAGATDLGVDPSGAVFITGYSGKKDFIIPSYQEMFYSLGVAKLKTPSPIPLRPERPKANRLRILCEGELPGDLTASGVNVKWYNDPYQKDLIQEGNVYKPFINKTDTFYVTQTISGIESRPKEVIVHFSELKDATLTQRNDTIFASTSPYYQYQWFYEGDSIWWYNPHSYLVPHGIGNYSVRITDGTFQKDLKITFINNLIASNLQEGSYSLYPNPTRGRATLVVKNESVGPLKIRIMDLNGKIITEREADDSYSFFIESFDISSFHSGIYLVRISGNNFNRTIKLSKK